MTLYLNNDGSRWIEVDRRGKRHMPIIVHYADGTARLRNADYYESFGNFAGVGYRIAGKRYRDLPWTHDGCETPSQFPADSIPHVWPFGRPRAY